jgi:hypothetical protein
MQLLSSRVINYQQRSKFQLHVSVASAKLLILKSVSVELIETIVENWNENHYFAVIVYIATLVYTCSALCIHASITFQHTKPQHTFLIPNYPKLNDPLSVKCYHFYFSKTLLQFRKSYTLVIYLRKIGRAISTLWNPNFIFMNSRFQLREFSTSTSRIHNFNFIST